MISVYVLEDRFGSMYIGISRNLEKRLQRHKKGECKTTSKLHTSSLKIIHSWEAPSFSLASRFERYLHALPKDEVLALVIDVPIWCKLLEVEAETKVLQSGEKAMDEGHRKFNPQHQFVSLPNADQLAKVKS